MPVERTRSNNSQGRQKSCSECAKSKRKCGMEQPSCARCVKQHFSCVYPQQPSRTRTAIPQSSTLEVSAEPSTTHLSMNASDLGDVNLDFDFDMSAIATASTADILGFDFPTSTSCISPFPDILQNPLNPDDGMALQRNSMQEKPSTFLTNLSPFAKARMGYFVEHMKLAPKMLVEQNCTPWMHPMLYEDHMPRCLQDAYASCALYIAKNQTNAERVARHIRCRAEELINATPPDTGIDILARTHAVMLYQLMLVFGGDMCFYAQAEALVPYLEDMGAMLMPIAAEENEHVGPLALYPATAACTAWKSFIFRESARRTVLAAYQNTVMFAVLGGQVKTCNQDYSLKSRITLSAHLWSATNAFDFAMSWNAKNHFVVKGLDFTDILENAQPDDLDVFGNILLISLQGIDDIRGWYHSRGGYLELPPSQ